MKRSLTFVSTLLTVLLVALGFSVCQAVPEGLAVAPPPLTTQSVLLAATNPLEGEVVTFQDQEEPPTPVADETGGEAVPPSDLAAVVDGQPITKDAYERQLNLAQWALTSQGYDLASEEGKQILDTVRRQVLEDMINSLIIEQVAASQGITVTPQTVDETVEKTIQEGGGRAGFEQWLKDTGQTEDDYRDMIRSQLLTEVIGEKVTGKLPDQAPQIHARHILVDTEEKALDILNQLQSGEDFAALSKEHSIDQGTKDQGGDLNWFPRQMMSPEIDEVVFKAEVGLIPEVVPDAFGTFHVLEVLEKDPQRELTEEQRNSLKASAFSQWLTGHRKEKEDRIERFIEFDQ